MINKIERCINITNASVIKFEEKGKSIVFNNPKRLNYKKVQVDGCTINKGARCDKLLLSEDEREEYFVELKGSDIKHAIEQIESSIQQLGEYAEKRSSYVICSKVAPRISTFCQKRKLYFKRQYNSSLAIKESRLEVNLYEA